MIKTISYKIFSIALALLVLFSTVSFTIEKHFCGDVLVDVSMFVEAEKCGMEALGETLKKKACCKDEIDVVKGQDELKVTTLNELDFEEQQFLTVFSCAYINLFKSVLKTDPFYNDYSPPHLVYDIQALDQVYII